ncbi:Lacal_2735 family protein [Catenovulum sp. SM1970]|uniref:DUF6435 family protein n=1 Tax=Marinifaba aquimaris TaxID=2741323 RepID=UPI0015747598|nr:DUF6435 family protein [Marinifaba aquimaris]NTS76264.1 Lacal_2735 family protein [Marinifaba aquimaris]
MFSFFKRRPITKLRRQYDKKLTDAMHAQRNGDIRTYSQLTAEAETLWQEIESLESQQSSNAS